MLRPGLISRYGGTVAAPTGPFVEDSFTDTAATALESHTGETGASWTKQSGSGMEITAAGRVKPSAGSGTVYYASGVPGSAEYDVECDIFVVNASDYLGPAGRIATGAETFYLAQVEPSAGQIALYKASSGSYTSLGTFSQTFSASNTYAIKLEIRNATKKVYVNGVERISSANNDITDAGRVGLRSFVDSSVGLHMDNLVGTNV